MEEREHKIALSFVEGVGPVTYRKILRSMEEKGLPVSDLFGSDSLEIAEMLSLKSSVSEALQILKDNLPSISETFDLLSERNVEVILCDDARYPRILTDSLGDSSPSLLYTYGNLDLLEQDSGGVVGTRDPDDTARSLARRAGAFLAREGRVVVSGCARGVDSIAQMEALDVGGSTIGVLGQGILSSRGGEILADSLDPSSCLLVSEFPPTQTWSTGAAMARNKTICALSKVMIVIQASARGGTLESGKAALKMGKPLFVVSPKDERAPGWEGNRILIASGAFPLDLDEDSGELDFSPTLNPPDSKRPSKKPIQDTLF